MSFYVLKTEARAKVKGSRGPRRDPSQVLFSIKTGVPDLGA